jgi:hypothetical protein
VSRPSFLREDHRLRSPFWVGGGVCLQARQVVRPQEKLQNLEPSKGRQCASMNNEHRLAFVKQPRLFCEMHGCFEPQLAISQVGIRTELRYGRMRSTIKGGSLQK